MSEQYESLRRSRCGCVHGEDGECLLVCSTHTEAVEGRAGIRMRTASGELTFFPLARATPEESFAQRMAVSLGVSVESMRAAMASAQEAFPPPEESLCGEEEDLVTGSVPVDELGLPLPGVAPQPTPWGEGSEAWLRHCQQAGRNRVRAYDEAFSLVQAQFTAWTEVFPSVARDVAARHGYPAPGEAELAALAHFAEGFAGFLGHLRAVTQNVTGGGR